MPRVRAQPLRQPVERLFVVGRHRHYGARAASRSAATPRSSAPVALRVGDVEPVDRLPPGAQRLQDGMTADKRPAEFPDGAISLSSSTTPSSFSRLRMVSAVAHSFVVARPFAQVDKQPHQPVPRPRRRRGRRCRAQCPPRRRPARERGRVNGRQRSLCLWAALVDESVHRARQVLQHGQRTGSVEIVVHALDKLLARGGQQGRRLGGGAWRGTWRS